MATQTQMLEDEAVFESYWKRCFSESDDESNDTEHIDSPIADEIIDAVLDSEECFDPFLLRHHCMSRDVERLWAECMLKSFRSFVASLEPEQQEELLTKTKEKY